MLETKLSLTIKPDQEQWRNERISVRKLNFEVPLRFSTKADKGANGKRALLGKIAQVTHYVRRGMEERAQCCSLPA